MDEVAADRRLDDYTSITDPATGAARYEGPQEQEEAARLAGSRLADWNMANSVGPVARDPVLGGGMRDRANARMTMQRQLMDAQLPWSKLPMSADDATRKMNELELRGPRHHVDAAAGAVAARWHDPRRRCQRRRRDFTRGHAPGVPRRGGRRIKCVWCGPASCGRVRLAPADWPTLGVWRGLHAGRYRGPDEVRWSSRSGGQRHRIWHRVYDIIVNDASPVDVLVKAGGGVAGAWATAPIGGMAGGAVAGPPGAFVGALIFGTAGAFGGQKLAEGALEWVKGN
jgi:hypothetical protein